MTPTEDARAKMAEAALEYAAEYHEYEGGIITGYVAIFEVTVPGKDPQVIWITGTGASPTEDDDGGIMEHRIEGMLRYVQRDLDYYHSKQRNDQ